MSRRGHRERDQHRTRSGNRRHPARSGPGRFLAAPDNSLRQSPGRPHPSRAHFSAGRLIERASHRSGSHVAPGSGFRGQRTRRSHKKIDWVPARPGRFELRTGRFTPLSSAPPTGREITKNARLLVKRLEGSRQVTALPGEKSAGSRIPPAEAPCHADPPTVSVSADSWPGLRFVT